MALVVETGTGNSSANSYLSEADADTYWTDHGAPTTWTGATTAVKETALIMATQYLDAKYNRRWRGTKASNTQRLSWPRDGITDFDEFAVPSDSLPRALTDATAEAAHRNITETDGLLPDVASAGIERERVKVGSLEEDITYSGSKDPMPTFSIIEALLRDLVFVSTLIERS